MPSVFAGLKSIATRKDRFVIFAGPPGGEWDRTSRRKKATWDEWAARQAHDKAPEPALAGWRDSYKQPL
ncbi:hypothetical protein ELF58_24625 [Salmonella enterica]|nr:hypothetical protein [Salmonella enterica]